MSKWTWLENGLFLLAWPLLLIASLFAFAGILHIIGWLHERFSHVRCEICAPKENPHD